MPRRIIDNSDPVSTTTFHEANYFSRVLIFMLVSSYGKRLNCDGSSEDGFQSLLRRRQISFAMLRLTSISGTRDSSPYILPSSSGHDQLRIPNFKDQLHIFIGALSPRSPVSRSSECYEFPVPEKSMAQEKPVPKIVKQQSCSGFAVNPVSNTRELAFGAFDDGAGPALKKRQNAYRKRCAGRIVFTVIIFAAAAAVFVFKLKISQQEHHLRENWKPTDGNTSRF